MNAHPRFLMHSIDAATYSARRHDKGASWPGTIAFLAVTLAICAVLLWADRVFV